MPYRGSDKSLARPGRKQARKHVKDSRDFNNIETRAVIKVFFSARQDTEGNSRHSDRNISLFASLVGLRTYQHPCIYIAPLTLTFFQVFGLGACIYLFIYFPLFIYYDFSRYHLFIRSQCSVLSTQIMLRAAGSGIWIPLDPRLFILLQNIQTGSGSHTVSYSLCTVVKLTGAWSSLIST